MNRSETDDRLDHVTYFSHIGSVRLPLSALNAPIDYEVAQPDADDLNPSESRTCWTPSTPSTGVSTRSTSRIGRPFATARPNPLSQQDDEALNSENVIALPTLIGRVQQVHSHTHVPTAEHGSVQHPTPRGQLGEPNGTSDASSRISEDQFDLPMRAFPRTCDGSGSSRTLLRMATAHRLFISFHPVTRMC